MNTKPCDPMIPPQPSPESLKEEATRLLKEITPGEWEYFTGVRDLLAVIERLSAYAQHKSDCGRGRLWWMTRVSDEQPDAVPVCVRCTREESEHDNGRCRCTCGLDALINHLQQEQTEKDGRKS